MAINASDVKNKINKASIRHCQNQNCKCEIDAIQDPQTILRSSFHLKGTACKDERWCSITELMDFL